MKKSMIVISVAVVVSFLLLFAGQVFSAEKRFGLADIPEIANKRALTLALEAGGEEDTLLPFVRKFEEKTGIKVNTEVMLFAVMYAKENIELVGKTGAYDVVIVEASWTNEWAPYLWSLEELAKKYEPEGVEAIRRDLAYLDAGLMRMASTREGVAYGWPYECYTLMMMYRDDVFNHPQERENFRKKYGYELAPALDFSQLRDQAEFFTRKRGELLKGRPLKHDLYGLGLMAGRFPHVQDEITAILWGMGGRWARTIRDKEGNAIGFKITPRDKALLKAAFEIYVDLLQFTPPGTLNAFWDFVMAQFSAGNIIIAPTLYDSCYPWMSAWGPDVAADARIGGAPTPMKQPYCGNFHFAVARDSKNPEGAYWLSKYMGSYEVHKAWIEAGFVPSRRDVVEEPMYRDPALHETTGWIPTMLETWDYQYPFVSTYLHFNSAAFGKIYDYMTELCHNVARGALTPERGVEEWVKTFTELQTKFGKLPVLR
ncbi:extracellular solute-binding protein [Candidatus Aerophobetes bacterium]|nr:extracellular solute-binding protein [Candidatus Aerophobetes bacterium]